MCIKILGEFRQNHTSAYKTSFMYIALYRCISVCVCGRTYYFNWQEAHKKKSFWGWLKLGMHLNMLVVLYEEISNVSHVLQMLKNGLKMSFCLPETYEYFKNIFLQQHQYLFLYVIFLQFECWIWISTLLSKKDVKKHKTLNKSNSRIWFQDYFPWLKLFFCQNHFS